MRLYVPIFHILHLGPCPLLAVWLLYFRPSVEWPGTSGSNPLLSYLWIPQGRMPSYVAVWIICFGGYPKIFASVYLLGSLPFFIGRQTLFRENPFVAVALSVVRPKL